MDTVSLASIIGTVLGTGLAVGVSLGLMAWRITGRLDRRMDRFEDAMAAFRVEMQRLAERQSHVGGRLDERGSPAD